MFKKILAVCFVLTLIYVGVYGKPETHSIRAMEICKSYLDRTLNRGQGMYFRFENKSYVAKGLRADFYMLALGYEANVRCAIRDNGDIWYLAIDGEQLIK